MSWFHSTPESEALLAEERLVLAATEAVHDAMAEKGVNRQKLAKLLNVRPSEISQRLSGKRNLTLRSLAQMLHVLGKEADLTLTDSETPGYLSPAPAYKYRGVATVWDEPLRIYTAAGDAMLAVVDMCMTARIPLQPETDNLPPIPPEDRYEAMGRLLVFPTAEEDESSDEDRRAVGCS